MSATTDVASTNGSASRQARLAAAVRTLRTRQSLSSIPVDRWVLIAGAVMVPLGIALILLGWYGAAHKPLIIQQFPYLISGGILGLGLMFTGGLFYFGYWVTRLVQENRTHTQALVEAIGRLEGAGGLPEEAGAVGPASGDGMLVATATGTMLHRPDCPVVANRDGVRRMKADAPGFDACKICDPDVVDSNVRTADVVRLAAFLRAVLVVPRFCASREPRDGGAELAAAALLPERTRRLGAWSGSVFVALPERKCRRARTILNRAPQVHGPCVTPADPVGSPQSLPHLSFTCP